MSLKIGGITVIDSSGNVDGRDLSTDGLKLDGVEIGATADQTITAGSGLTGGGTGDVTISHATLAGYPASSSNINNSVIQNIEMDAFGHVTSFSSVCSYRWNYSSI